jgi:PAS domain S-box-containing protein
MVNDAKKPATGTAPFLTSGELRARSQGEKADPIGGVHSTAVAVADEDGFSALFESSGEALLLTDSSGMIQRANSRARQLLGLREKNAHGVSLGTVLAEQSGAGVLLLCDAANPAKRSTVEATLVTGHPIRITLRWVLGHSRSLLLYLEEGSLVQRAERNWRRVEAELRSVLDSVPTGIVVFDRAGNVRFCSTRFGEFFGIDGRTLGEAKTMDALREVLAPRFRDPKTFSAPWEAFTLGQGEPSHDELDVVRPAGRVIARFSRPVLDSEGRAIGWLQVYSDVTGERQIQAKMLQTEKMAAMGRLVSGIAHELNNPLTAIMGYAQLLLGHGLKPARLEEARKVYQEAERARRIVKNLLYFARENEPQRTRVDLNEVVQRALALRSYELKVENIEVKCDLAPDLPVTLADPYQLQQVILNLLINAEQALVEERAHGHVFIRTRSAARRESAPRGERSGRWMIVEIEDDGPGILPEIAYRVFDPFFTTKAPGVGTGLGLSIVYGIVHQHAGEVTLDSRPGIGTKFVIELPVVSVAVEKAAVPSSRDSRSVKQGPKGRILVIEDEATVAQLIMDVLREEGHQVTAVLDSKEGLEQISRRPYDLIICDLRMPGLDGPAFYDVLVRTGSPLQNKILFVTGDTLGPRTIEFLVPNDLPYLAKPFLVEELKLAVHQLLMPDERERAHAARHRQG